MTEPGSNIVSPEQRREAEAAIAKDLVRRIQAGDRDAEQTLVLRYSRGVIFLLRRKSGDPALADDLHQEAFRVVLERLRDRGLDDPSKLSAFIRATAINMLTGIMRRRQRRATEPDLEAIDRTASATSGQFDEAAREESAHGVRELLQELNSDRDRDLLVRFYLLQEDKASICQSLDLTDLHFNRVLFRARRRFKQILQDRGWQSAEAVVNR